MYCWYCWPFFSWAVVGLLGGLGFGFGLPVGLWLFCAICCLSGGGGLGAIGRPLCSGCALASSNFIIIGDYELYICANPITIRALLWMNSNKINNIFSIPWALRWSYQFLFFSVTFPGQTSLFCSVLGSRMRESPKYLASGSAIPQNIPRKSKKQRSRQNQYENKVINNQKIGGLIWVASRFNCFLDGLGLESVSDLGGLFCIGLVLFACCLTALVSIVSFLALRLPKSQSNVLCIQK